MGENSEISVYSLITKLCEKFARDEDHLKKLRSRSYSILLGKTQTPQTGLRDVRGPNAYCSLLAWQFVLSTKYGLDQYAEDMRKVGEEVYETYGNDVLQFFLNMRQIPTFTNEFADFDLPESFQNLYRNPAITNDSEASSAIALPLTSQQALSPDVWEIALKEEYNATKNWEYFGLPEPDKEKPFLSELGRSSHIWVESLMSVYNSSVIRDGTVIKPKVKSQPEFVKDIKYLLVGLASYSFGYDENRNFILAPGITVDGIPPSSLKSLCEDLIFCGMCFKALKEISEPDPNTGKYKQAGYIFTEFCLSIKRYLAYFRAAIMHLPDSYALIKIVSRTKNVRYHLKALTSICKLGPYSESEGIPQGVYLLNYLYHTILKLTDTNTILVLYAILFPCCQVYFNRFLQQWLLGGSIVDPFDEFFIKVNYKFVITRGRTYWTRTFIVREDFIPDFLVDLKNDILNTGKAMNLLKLSAKSSKLCSYLMGKNPLIISSCVTSEQLSNLKRNVESYYLEVLSECGPMINLQQIINRTKEQDPIFMNLIAKKRAATLERIELERKKKFEEQREKKFDELAALKEQYDSALQLKQKKVASEIESEIKLAEFNLSIENFRDTIIAREAEVLIDYYNDLFEVSENRKKKIERHIEVLKNNHLEPSVAVDNKSSDDSFYSVKDVESDDKFADLDSQETETEPKIHSSKSLDIINANAATDNFELAKKIKEKVLKEELGLLISSTNKTIPVIKKNDNQNLTEAQRNKLRVLNSEFGIEFKPQIKIPKKTLTQCEINRNLVLGSNECFYGDSRRVDNANFVNRNNVSVIKPNFEEGEVVKLKKSSSLSLDVANKIDYPVPMSVDSTPMSDSTTSRICLSVDNIDSVPTTAGTHVTDEGELFAFREQPIQPTVSASYEIPFSRKLPENQKKIFSKRVTEEEASDVRPDSLRLFLHESIATPLARQKELAENELLKYFIEDLQYFQHLASLRDYFFLQDGEFGRNITENLFIKLYDAQSPIELINCGTLRNLLFNALEMSGKFQENSHCLSFKINNLPKTFNLGDPDVLDCLSLTYKVTFPLNILLPFDTIGKYNEVFKYILKLNRISWVLKKVFFDLEILAKISGNKGNYLMMSPHYRKLHQCRHVMMHFIQTLQNYIVGEVLQTGWDIFEKNIAVATNVDVLYLVHTAYIKNVLFLCLLNQKSTPLRKVMQKIFVVILKFYDHLRSRNWKCEDGIYTHPNFSNLENIFKNFEELVLYFFKLGRKVVKSGYQPHLTQLLDMLDVNDYYSKKHNCAAAT